LNGSAEKLGGARINVICGKKRIVMELAVQQYSTLREKLVALAKQEGTVYM
jgi:hypothetical protein